MGVLGVFREGCLVEFAIPVFRWDDFGDEAQEATLGSSVDVCLAGILVAGAVWTLWVEVFRRSTFLGLTAASGIPVSVNLFLECHSSNEVWKSEQPLTLTLFLLTGFCRDPLPIFAWPTLLDVRLGACIAILKLCPQENARPCMQCRTGRLRWWMRYIAHVPHRQVNGLAMQLSSACL